MLVSGVVLLGLAFYVYSFIAEMFGLGLSALLVFAPFVLLGVEVIEDLRTYFRPSKYAIEPLTEPQQSRVQRLAEPILRLCNLNHHPIHYLPTEEDYSTGVVTRHDSAYLILEDGILDRPDHELQSVLAHEIIHVRFSEGLRDIFLSYITKLLYIYTVTMAPILLFIYPQIPGYIIIFGLAISVRLFTSWPKRIGEITADTGATLLGFGPGLHDFFTNAPYYRGFFVWLHDIHESRPKRMARISRLTKHLR